MGSTSERLKEKMENVFVSKNANMTAGDMTMISSNSANSDVDKKNVVDLDGGTYNLGNLLLTDSPVAGGITSTGSKMTTDNSVTFVFPDKSKVNILRENFKLHAPELAAKYPNGNVIQMVDWNAVQFQKLADYCKNGCIGKNEDGPELLKMAHKIGLAKLKDECEQFLKSTLKIDTVIELLFLADSTKAETLKKEAIDFFLDHDLMKNDEIKKKIHQKGDINKAILRAKLTRKKSTF